MGTGQALTGFFVPPGRQPRWLPETTAILRTTAPPLTRTARSCGLLWRVQDTGRGRAVACHRMGLAPAVPVDRVTRPSPVQWAWTEYVRRSRPGEVPAARPIVSATRNRAWRGSSSPEGHGVPPARGRSAGVCSAGVRSAEGCATRLCREGGGFGRAGAAAGEDGCGGDRDGRGGGEGAAHGGLRPWAPAVMPYRGNSVASAPLTPLACPV